MTVVDKNILIAYYSYSGNTEAAAKEIQNLTNGTLVSIEREEAYPEDYDEMTEIAEAEILYQETPTIKMDLVNLDDYDVVFLVIQSGGIKIQP